MYARDIAKNATVTTMKKTSNIVLISNRGKNLRPAIEQSTCRAMSSFEPPKPDSGGFKSRNFLTNLIADSEQDSYKQQTRNTVRKLLETPVRGFAKCLATEGCTSQLGSLLGGTKSRGTSDCRADVKSDGRLGLAVTALVQGRTAINRASCI